MSHPESQLVGTPPESQPVLHVESQPSLQLSSQPPPQNELSQLASHFLSHVQPELHPESESHDPSHEVEGVSASLRAIMQRQS